MTSHAVTRILNEYTGKPVGGEYLYRGIAIERDDARRGYWGHWVTSFAMRQANGQRIKERSETRKDLLSKIDALLDSRAA